MQKPTIEKVWEVMVDDVIQSFTDEQKANEYYAKELAKYQAAQEPTVLFDSETVKVMKFANKEQFKKWNEEQDNYSNQQHRDYDYSTPILIVVEKASGERWAVCNITSDLIKAVQSVNVATVKQAENYRSDKCECGHSIDYDDNHYNFCPNCGKTLIKEVE